MDIGKIQSSLLDLLMNIEAMGWGEKYLTDIILALAIVLLVYVTLLVKRTADAQFAASLMAAFQDEWHDKIHIMMRDCLGSEAIKKVFQTAVRAAYGKEIEYEKTVAGLLTPPSPKDDTSDELRIFETTLRSARVRDPKSKETLFTGYEALNRVLLCFDRLAILRNDPHVMKKFINSYRPPLRNSAGILQAFIAVRIALRKDEDKDYKKDYVQLLHMLSLDDAILYKKCKKGLKGRGEW